MKYKIEVAKSVHGTTNVYTNNIHDEKLRHFLLTFSAWGDSHMMETELYMSADRREGCKFTEAIKEFYDLANQQWFKELVARQFNCELIFV